MAILRNIGRSVHPWNEDGSQGGGWGPIPGGDATNSWHIYGCRVDPQWITFYIDGIESRRVRTNSEYLAEPLYIIIDYALRGDPVSGDKFDTKEPSHMLVDWVRAYELPAEDPVRLSRRRSLLSPIPASTTTTRIRRRPAPGKNGAIWDQIQMSSRGRAIAIAVPAIT